MHWPCSLCWGVTWARGPAHWNDADNIDHTETSISPPESQALAWSPTYKHRQKKQNKALSSLLNAKGNGLVNSYVNHLPQYNWKRHKGSATQEWLDTAADLQCRSTGYERLACLQAQACSLPSYTPVSDSTRSQTGSLQEWKQSKSVEFK